MRAGVPVFGETRPRAALALVCTAQFVVVLDVTIVAIALPAIQAELGFVAKDLQWVVSAYTLVFGGFLMVAGRAGDLFGRRMAFVGGLVLFGGASLACALAESQWTLITARVVQGLGAAFVSPAALALLTSTFAPGRERGRALGAWTSAAAVGGAAGWLAGGVLTETLGWEWVFLVNVPIAAVCAAAAPATFAASRRARPRARLDVVGAVTVTAGLGLLMLSLTLAYEGGFADPATLGALGGSLVMLAAFVAVESRAREPLVALGMFRNRDVVGGTSVMGAVNAATNGPLLLCILYLQNVLDRSPSEAGAAFVPFNLSVVTGSTLGPRVSDALGPRAAAIAGLVAVGGGVSWLLGVDVDGSYLGDLLPAFVLMGNGVGIAAVAATVAATRATDDDHHGVAAATLNTSAQVGTALGIAALVTLATPRAEVSSAAGDAAFVGGVMEAFLGGAALAALGALAATRIRGRGERVSPRGRADDARSSSPRATGGGAARAPSISRRRRLRSPSR